MLTSSSIKTFNTTATLTNSQMCIFFLDASPNFKIIHPTP